MFPALNPGRIPGRLTLITQSGHHDLTVDVAGNSSQAEYGLRYRPMLQPDEGLLILQSRAFI